MTAKARSLILLAFTLAFITRAAEPPIPIRGYYMTFMRMPTFALPQWKQMINCLADDGGDTLLLWTAGAFRSKKFPITWEYNRTHKNIEADFVRDLIDYAHTKRIKVLLGFTPFAYDGVNQHSVAHPELKATDKNGQPANFWGMHSWGYNLCPSQPESQRFLLEYVREMFFDFYPNADGLLIESSDYAICYCPKCREKYFDREFQFVRQISDDVWRAKPEATIMVYPHYFSTRKVPGFDVPGAQQKFDPRWTLFFTPHSAHIDTNLMALAKASIYSDTGLTLGTPNKIRAGARVTKQNRLTGYIPSLEPFSCPAGPPKNPGPLLKPFHFEWLKDGEMPLNELLMRVNRIAYREYTRDPALADAAFCGKLSQEIFGGIADQRLADLLYLQESWFFEADWFTPGMLLTPQRVKDRAAKEKWKPERLDQYSQRVDRLRVISERYASSNNAAEREVHRLCDLIVQKWKR